MPSAFRLPAFDPTDPTEPALDVPADLAPLLATLDIHTSHFPCVLEGRSPRHALFAFGWHDAVAFASLAQHLIRCALRGQPPCGCRGDLEVLPHQAVRETWAVGNVTGVVRVTVLHIDAVASSHAVAAVERFRMRCAARAEPA